MSRGVNKVILIGHLGQDPELRYTPSGTAVTNVSLATNEPRQDANGERRDHTEWHRAVFFGRLAEVCCQYLTKGSQVFIEGRLQTREWERDDGIKRYTTEIIVRDMQMLSSRGSSGPRQNAPVNNDYSGYEANDWSNQNNQPNTNRPAPASAAAPPAKPQSSASPAAGSGNNNYDKFDDDVPF